MSRVSHHQRLNGNKKKSMLEKITLLAMKRLRVFLFKKVINYDWNKESFHLISIAKLIQQIYWKNDKRK